MLSRAETEAIVGRLKEANPGKWENVKHGHKSFREWFIDQTLRYAEGKGDKELIRSVVEEKLNA